MSILGTSEHHCLKNVVQNRSWVTYIVVDNRHIIAWICLLSKPISQSLMYPTSRVHGQSNSVKGNVKQISLCFSLLFFMVKISLRNKTYSGKFSLNLPRQGISSKID